MVTLPRHLQMYQSKNFLHLKPNGVTPNYVYKMWFAFDLSHTIDLGISLLSCLLLNSLNVQLLSV